MRIKAKYVCGYLSTTCYKYFHNVDEMNAWFNFFKGNKLISYEEGDHVEAEAFHRGYR